MQHLLVYFCNIHMKQMQHTSETSETLETYIYNIGEGKARPVDSGRRGRRSSVTGVREGAVAG
jgi:hypothetical protein